MAFIRTSKLGNVLVLKLDRPPAHAISPGLLGELAAALEALAREPPAALVLTASGERFFSAGLDLIELHDLDRPAIEAFGRELVRVLLGFFRLPMPVVAAVNGHAIAGGAILALTAERRLLARGEHLFGLNEVQVGLPLPGALFEVVRAAISPRHAAEVLLEGKNYGVEAALAVGFAHELVERAALEARALEVASKLARVPPRAYQRMKELLNAGAELRIPRWLEGDPFADIWFDETTRRVMGAAREKLLKKRPGAPPT